MPDNPGTGEHLAGAAGTSAPHDIELLTTAEVAHLLRCSVDSVRRRAKSGAIPGRVEGVRPWRFRARDVRAWLGLDGGTP